MNPALEVSPFGECIGALLQALRGERPPSPFFASCEPSRRSLFLREAVKHYVAPLLYLRLRRAPLPAVWLKDLRAQYLRNGERNLRIFHELSKALRALADAGIPVLLLKGGYLAPVVYGNIGARVLEDVDLLFREGDFARAQRVLFGSRNPPFSRRLPLDLHDRLESSLTRRPIATPGVWGRSEAVEIGGIAVRVPAPEDLLVHLSVHLAFHHRFQLGALRTFCDIRETIRHFGDRLDWEKAWRRASEWGSEKPFCLALSLARELIGAEFPELVFASLVKRGLKAEVHRWAIEQIFHANRVEDPLSTYFWRLLGHGPLREKLHLAAGLLFVRPQALSGTSLAPVRSVRNYLYYGVRFLENLRRYVRALWRIFTRDEQMSVFRARQQQNVAMMEWLASRPDPLHREYGLTVDRV